MIKRNKWASDNEISLIQDEVKNTIKKCVEFSENSSFPESSSLYENVYDQNYQFIKD